MVGGGALSKPRGGADDPAACAEPTPSMYLAICTAMVGAIMFGIDCGNFGAVQGFRSFQDMWCVGNFGDEVTCGPDEHSGAAANARWLSDFVQWASMLLFVGAAFGSLLLGPVLTNSLGRRPCVSTGAGVCFVGCLMTSYWSLGNINVFLMGRFVTGFGVGVCCFALPLYNSEVSAPAIRGTTGALFQLNVVLGQMLAAILTCYCQDWRVGMVLPGAAGAFVMVAVWATPESPRYVMAKEGYEAGLVVLKKLRKGEHLEAEAREVYDQLLEESKAGQVAFSDILLNRSLRKRVFIACWLQVAQQFTGFNALVMYSSTLFIEMGFENPFAVNMAFTGAQVFGIIGGLLLLDSRIGGRRIQLLAVTAIICPLLMLTGFAVLFSWPQALTAGLIAAFALVWQHAWGMIPWVYPSELFTMAERDRATSLAVFVQYASNAVLMVALPLLMARLGAPGMLLFFGGFNVFNLAFVYVFMLETKGVPLEEIPALFGAEDGSSALSDDDDDETE